MAKKKLCRAFISIILTLAFVFANSITCFADAPYKTYTEDVFGKVIETQTAYLPYMTITKVGDENLSGPTDMCIASDGLIYVCDTGNKRIIVSDRTGGFIKTIGEGTLNTPRGIYVTDDGNCYVADKDARAVFVFNKNGELINKYGKPDHPLYGDNLDFLPVKIVVNSSGTMYIVCESNTNGIVQISPVNGGTFLGYFGTNTTSLSLWDIAWRAIQTEAQRNKSVSNLPATPDNLAIDEKGLIYTVTRGQELETLKKLNIAGTNMFKGSYVEYDGYASAVAVGNHENIFMVSALGYIYEYNYEGELLFIFGGSDDGRQRIGLCTKAEAISIDANDLIYVLDSDKNQIQIFEPTEVTDNLHNALYLYSKGKYTESKEPLNEVLKMNRMFEFANRAMAKVLLQEENYSDAMYFSKLSYFYDCYSEAFWEERNDWLVDNLVFIILAIVILLILSKCIKYFDRKKHILAAPKSALGKFGDIKLIRELRFTNYFMRHPFDGCYGVKREKKTSMLSACILLVVIIIVMVINKYMCGFLVKTVREGRFSLASDIGMVVILAIVVTVCIYLISTINEGEAKIKDLFCALVYSFTPFIYFTALQFVLSHVLSYNEIVFFNLAQIAMWVWIAVLLFISIKEINNYTVFETIKVILLTIFTILILALLVFIIYVLFAQVIEFIESIFGEVANRLGF